MTWRDKLEIGLKEDAPFREDNLPANQVRGPQIPKGPGRSSEIRWLGTTGTKCSTPTPGGRVTLDRRGDRD